MDNTKVLPGLFCFDVFSSGESSSTFHPRDSNIKQLKICLEISSSLVLTTVNLSKLVSDIGNANLYTEVISDPALLLLAQKIIKGHVKNKEAS